jgi:hypothetical protein
LCTSRYQRVKKKFHFTAYLSLKSGNKLTLPSDHGKSNTTKVLAQAHQKRQRNISRTWKDTEYHSAILDPKMMNPSNWHLVKVKWMLERDGWIVGFRKEKTKGHKD